MALVPHLRQLALEAALAGAEVIRAVTEPLTQRYKSSLRDIVTDVDTAAEAAITEYLGVHRPDDGLLCEESGVRAGSSGVRWVIDPLDGTANYVRGRDDYAVAVAAEISGTPVAGAIVRPASGRWIVGDDTGVVGDPVDPSVSETSNLAQALVSVSVNADRVMQPVSFALLGSFLPHVQDFRRTASTSCDLFGVATGVLDAYVGLDTLPWDQAAGWALVSAAGGRCVELPFGANHVAFIAGSPAVVERLIPLVEGAAEED